MKWDVEGWGGIIIGLITSGRAEEGSISLRRAEEHCSGLVRDRQGQGELRRTG